MFSRIPFSHIMLGIYQIAGGMLGVAVVIGLFNRSLDSFDGALTLILSWVAILYIYSIYCGVLLIIGNRKGLNQTQINLYLQVISVFVYGFAFQYYSGIYLSVGVYLIHPLHFTTSWGLSTFRMNLAGKSDTILFNLNLVALGLILYTDKLIRKERAKELFDQQQRLKKTV